MDLQGDFRSLPGITLQHCYRLQYLCPSAVSVIVVVGDAVTTVYRYTSVFIQTSAARGASHSHAGKIKYTEHVHVNRRVGQSAAIGVQPV